jgi:two-component system sensor histidine kinase AlgZ
VSRESISQQDGAIPSPVIDGATPIASSSPAAKAAESGETTTVAPRTSAAEAFDDMLEEAALAVDSPVPDWCNLGLMLRIVLVLNGLFFCIAALQSASIALWLDQWLGLAMLIEPVLIASLFFGCLIRRVTWRWPEPVQFAIPIVLPAVLTLIAQRLMSQIGSGDPLTQWRNAVFAALIAASVLYWARLRERAYSPALAEAQLQALQSRIRPHFLFNSLNAALGLIRSDPRRAETVLEDIADLFRVLMRDSRERVPLANEISLCKQYLAIEQLRLGDRLTTTWQVDDGALHALVPTLLLQPLIENAVHHGIEPSSQPGAIDIGITRTGRYVDITITNPWQGDASAEATRGNRIGLDNVRQRLALVHDLEATIDSGVRDQLYIVHIRLPAERRRAPRGGRPAA